MVRAVDDKGGSINGGAAQVGNVGVAIARRSATTCRASMISVPGSKIKTIDDNCSTDLERMTASPGVPLKTSSNGTVTNCSTSVEESPRHGVWISTRGGANSGKTSTGMASI